MLVPAVPLRCLDCGRRFWAVHRSLLAILRSLAMLLLAGAALLFARRALGDCVRETMPSHVSDRGRAHDYERTNRDAMVDHDDDAAAPSTGHLRDASVGKGITFRNYGELVAAPNKSSGRRHAARRALMRNANLDPAFGLGAPAEGH